MDCRVRAQNSVRCTASQCKDAQTAERAAARTALPVVAPCAPKAEPTTCFKIKEVLGVSMCTEKMTDEESRCGRARSDEEICHQLRGKFGKSSDEDVDDMVPGTRWVKLTDWSRTSTKLAVREGMHGAPSHPTKRLHKSPCSPSAAKILPLRGADCSALRRTISFMGGRRAEKGCRQERKVQKHAARRGGSGNQGAVAQFSTGRRRGNWQCTRRPLGSSGFCRCATLQAGRG